MGAEFPKFFYFKDGLAEFLGSHFLPLIFLKISVVLLPYFAGFKNLMLV